MKLIPVLNVYITIAGFLKGNIHKWLNNCLLSRVFLSFKEFEPDAKRVTGIEKGTPVNRQNEILKIKLLNLIDILN